MVQEHQPAATSEMSQKPADSLVHKYSEGAAKEAGKETVKYVSENSQTQTEIDTAKAQAKQQYDDAKAEASGMWAKYCSCLSG